MDNNGYFPYAADWGAGGYKNISHDDLLSAYDGRELTRAEMEQGAAPVRGPVDLWACPSDDFTVGNGDIRRTYVMNRGGRTGAGPEDIRGIAGEQLNSSRTTQVDNPSQTIAMTENAMAFWSGDTEYARHLGSPFVQGVLVDNPANQDGTYTINGSWSGKQRVLHPPNRFNYLFCDGHVAAMRGEETIGTGSMTNPRGMWTKGAGD